MIAVFFRLPHIRLKFILAIGCMALMLGCAGAQNRPEAPEKDAAQTNNKTTKTITAVGFTKQDETVSVRIDASDILAYTSVKQPSPLSVILYFPHTGLGEIKSTYPIKDDVVGAINSSVLKAGGSTARIEIVLKKDVAYEVVPAGNGLKVVFQKPLEVAQKPPAAPASPPETTAPAVQPLVPAADAAPARTLFDVEVESTQNGTSIFLRADGVIKDYQVMTVKNPPRIVFDIFNLKSLHTQQQAFSVNTSWVKSVRYFGYPQKIRLVLDTTSAFLYAFTSRPVTEGLKIYVGEAAKDSSVTTSASKEATPATTGIIAIDNLNLRSAPDAKSPPLSLLAKGTRVTVVSKQGEWLKIAHGATVGYIRNIERYVQLAAKPAAIAVAPTVWVNRIDFSSEKDGRSQVTVGTTRPVNYEIKKTSAKRLLLSLTGATIPEYRRKPLITTRFASAVDRVLPLPPVDSKTAQIAIELREAVPYFVEELDNMIVVHLEASTVAPRPLAAADLPKWQTAMDKPLVASRRAEAGQPQKQPEETLAPDQSGRFHGEKIALDFYETDIKNVFRILKEISAKNFAVDQDVTGKVTISLEKPVPWDQVLDLILKMNRLGMIMEGDIIRIASLETLRAEEEQRRAQFEAVQKAKQQQKALEPLITEYISINYSNAKNDILPHLENIRTKERGSLSADERTNVVIFTDTAAKIEKALAIVKQLDKVTPQVIIEARIVEASTSFSRELGTKWGIGVGTQPSSVLPSSIGSWVTSGDLAVASSLDGAVGGGSTGSSSTYGFNMGMNFPVQATNKGTIGINFANIGGSPLLLNMTLAAMESEGKGKIISAPKIVTLDNKEATIEQGLQYPINRLDDSGNTVTEFKDINLVLKVTPHVTPDNRISMSIIIEKTDIGPVISGNQSFTSKKAQTQLLVSDGDTVVIGGILKTTQNDSETGIPLLSKIPILGWLFKTADKVDNKEELLIFITPRIVQLEQR